MISHLCQVEDEEIDKLLDNPEYILEFLYGEPRPILRTGFLSFLLGNKPKKPAEPGPEWVRNKSILQTDLDKTWHGIHFLLTETDWDGEEPLCYLVKGGKEIGNIDVGYGPARSIKAVQVKRFADALNNIEIEELKRRFNPKKMMELDIYPTIWDRGPEEDDTLEYLIWGYNTLRAFVNEAAEKDKGLIFYIN
jgi:hypothetical protein